MRFTSSKLLLLLKEIEHQLISQKLSEIHGSRYSFNFLLYPSRKTFFFSLHPEHACMFLSERIVEKGKEKSPFLLILKKYITGSYIKSIEQINFDRVVKMTFLQKITTEREKEYHLYIELIHRYSNAILTDEKDRIIGALKNISAEQNRVRNILPGITYTPPPIGEKVNPLTIDREQFYRVIRVVQTHWEKIFIGMDKETVENFKKLSPLSWEQFEDWRDNLLTSKTNQSISSEIENSFKREIEEEKINSLRNRLLKEVKKAIEQINKKLRKIESGLKESSNYEELREMAETLLVYKNTIPQNKGEITLQSIYNPNRSLEIQIDTSMSLEKNIEKMFKQYKKLKKKYQMLPEIRSRLILKLFNLQELKEKINKADLQMLKSMDKEVEQTAKKTSERLPYREFRVGNWKILVGKNSRTNEMLTFKIAGKEDIWFHTKSIPGSHIILRVDTKEQPSEKIINIAAQIAAFYSKAHEGTKVAVDYTKKKYVKKPPGSPTGFVTYRKHKTLLVRKAQDLKDILQNP